MSRSPGISEELMKMGCLSAKKGPHLDIVSRLRDRGFGTIWGSASEERATLDEAASEIERLRKELSVGSPDGGADVALSMFVAALRNQNDPACMRAAAEIERVRLDLRDNPTKPYSNPAEWIARNTGAAQ